VVYHHHHGSFGRSSDRERLALSERNALLTVLKNYDDANLRRALPAAAQLMAFRAFLSSGIDAAALRPPGYPRPSRVWRPYAWIRDAVRYYGPRAWRTLSRQGLRELGRKVLAEAKRRRALAAADKTAAATRGPTGGTGPGHVGTVHRTAASSLEAAGRSETSEGADARGSTCGPPARVISMVPDRTLAYFDAARDLLACIDSAADERARVQALRRRPDEEVFQLFGKPLVPNYPDREHFRALQVASDIWSLYALFPKDETRATLASRGTSAARGGR
jgi:hypothetical protein